VNIESGTMPIFAQPLAQRRSTGLSCLLVLLLSWNALSFLHDRAGGRATIQHTSIQRRKAKTPLFATVYSPDGHIEEYYYEDSGSSGDTALAESLSQKYLSTLARLACAFAPDGHGLHLKDLDSVTVLTVDEDHIEISAILCDDGSCVSVAVPVNFPHPCGGLDDMTECILENINELDHQAEGLISGVERKEASREDDEKMSHVLINDENIEFPSWWVSPSLIPGMAEECRSVRNLLNEKDFQPEIHSLASQALKESNEDGFVEKVGVAAVGPAGLILRALAEEVQNHHHPVKVMLPGPSNDIVNILEIPVAFRTEAANVEDLRASVLGTVASACVD
jgi:hypothetical protein